MECETVSVIRAERLHKIEATLYVGAQSQGSAAKITKEWMLLVGLTAEEAAFVYDTIALADGNLAQAMRLLRQAAA